MSSRLSPRKSSSGKSSLNSEEEHSGWNINPENGLSDIYLNYETNQMQKQSDALSPSPSPQTPNSATSPDPVESQTSSISSNLSPVYKSLSQSSNKSPMILSNLSFKTQQYDFFNLNKIKSEEDESEYQPQKCFRKFKTESLLPEQMTESELRMENRYWKKLRNDYLKKMEDERMLEQKMEFVKAKTKINQLSAQRNERKKIQVVKNNEIYESKMKDKVPSRSLSLPLIKSKIIDLGTRQVYPRPNPQLRENVKSELNKLSKMTSNDLKAKRESLAGKCYCKPIKASGKLDKDTNKDCSAVEEIENVLRKNGVTFDVTSIKKGLIESVKSQQLTSFPSKSLISNPIYRKWGL